ncbi:MAG: catecholate siderophore receptor Fiu [Pseudomonadota bacterium]
MAYIKSRKHGIARPATTAMGLALASLTGHAAEPVTAAVATESQTALPAVSVKAAAQRAADYKAEALSSPKFTQPLVDTTQTVSVIKEQVIKERAATTLTEALRNVAGVGTFYAGENGNTSTGDTVYMRGFDSSSSIYVDGVRDLGSISRDTFNIEQIEVIKGPAGTDYGRSAPTGSINLVTKQANLSDSFDASLGVGSGRYQRATLDWNKALDGYEGAAFRLNLLAQDAGVDGRHEVENNRWGIAPSLAFGLNTPTRVFVNLLHIKQDNVPDGGVLTIGMPGYSSPDPSGRPFLNTAARVDASNFYGTASDHDDVTADMATVRLEHDFAPGTTLRNTTRWGRTTQDYLLSSFLAAGSGTNQILTPSAADPSSWTVVRNINFKDQVNKILTNQTNLTTAVDTGALRHELSMGLELTREEQVAYTHAVNGTAPRASVYDPDSSVTVSSGSTGAYNEGATDTWSVYAFDTIKLGPQWQLNAGLRYDRYSTDFKAVSAAGAKTADLHKSGDLVNWKLGALYKLTPDGSVYVNYALSQQPPGGATFLSATASNANNPNLDPQKAKTAEIGAKWEFFAKRLMLAGAVFRTEIENEVVTNTDGTIDQTGKKRVQGVELSATGQLTPSWAVIAGYTVQDTKVLKGANVAQNGSDELTYTPKDAFSLWTTWQAPHGITLGGGARYNGGLKRGTDGAVGTPNFTESYWVWDAMAGYKISRNVDIQLNVYNLFDKDYVAAINKSGYRYFPGTPRSARVTANFHF